MDELDELLSTIGLSGDNGTIILGLAVLESMGVAPGDSFTEDEFINAGSAFARGLRFIAPYIVSK